MKETHCRLDQGEHFSEEYEMKGNVEDKSEVKLICKQLGRYAARHAQLFAYSLVRLQ